jgi:RHS repeat-associated protein
MERRRLNDQGYRTQKVITEGTSIYTYEYELQGSCVIRETLTKTVNGLLTESYELIFLYDVNNTHIGFLLDGIEYFYLTDLLGNIISILAEDGTEMVKYEYDAYGNIINSLTGTLSTINPYTYRGYRYDFEIGMYYLNSRYYNPQSGFFISSDGLLGETGDIQSTNMYVYCVNNPVTNVDVHGYFPTEALITLINIAIIIIQCAWALLSVKLARKFIASKAGSYFAKKTVPSLFIRPGLTYVGPIVAAFLQILIEIFDPVRGFANMLDALDGNQNGDIIFSRIKFSNINIYLNRLLKR